MIRQTDPPPAASHEAIRATFTNEVIRAIGALARQQNVCREQGGQVVFVTGMEAAREYIVEHVEAALAQSPASLWQPGTLKHPRPCPEGWESADPGGGSFSPNPCVRCGWSQEDHAKFESPASEDVNEQQETRVDKTHVPNPTDNPTAASRRS